ncbi:phosphoserine aminotransferase [Basidiobolus meristosporus CBS 931.73]|uniref:Phosphoserine aminotransferase n=1 Tax=Basidiobolus meristosporus CBS 931.73 TaxID=1314790 RepID=A0A1Y1ZB08_9FUNG|nr:phosphoserine aminotransferase [Basidiobolus meristosporus CBS 931.73]|eukprot:ORY07187.1 phosphoserine aminotransferase [Basidiobolus meristosporus CBS 931.73]
MTTGNDSPKVWNFGAGPSVLPRAVLEKAQKDLLDYEGTGMSVVELSHRSKTFQKLMDETTSNLKTLLNIPDNYRILFMQGGGSTQFSAVVFNLLAHKGDRKATVDYLVTGSWSQKASEEAKHLGANVNIVFNTKKDTGSYTSVPPKETWKLTGSEAAYVYYCDNETVHGVEFDQVPEIDPSVPLVCDMSSNILSREVDVSKFGIIYAGAQKNMGPSGVTIVIIREDLLDRPAVENQESAPWPIPLMFDYKIQADNGSLYNTPPMFSIYVVGLVLEWLLQLGGISAIQAINERKAKKLYDVIDKYDIYKCPVDVQVRSKMNVPFRLTTEELEKEFLKGAEELHMAQLKGHRSVGGIRASLYNAMEEEGVQALTQYMEQFAQSH